MDRTSSRKAFAQFYAEHHNWLCSLLRRRLGNSMDAADLAHDIYLHMFRKGQLPQACDSRRHLTRMARCKLIDLYRRRTLESDYLGELSQREEPHTASEETRALASEALEQLSSTLSRQPVKARQALLLHRLEGKAYRDIATELNVSVSSVEKYLAAVLKSCRQAACDTRSESN
ncbi:sigma-70 family RNA polymerase sigma factor [Pseudomonas sp. NCCP-436]|uniref:sigma-70 family RNA polymerase sigma factor n=1 Tax=Pseudomonas sp. NCCP-436 TaxID=2842481 RepID=UPI001DCE7DE3|nr:sigma-70 family RNA polymerase sigma factor [Pseudomonas sp. NCCP-436]GIZ12518.1 RNA polymerase sigma factor [Pseudomonas sp. NCCP-436]